MFNEKLSLKVSEDVSHSVEHNYSVTQRIIESNPELIQKIFANRAEFELIEEAEIIEDEPIDEGY